MFCKRKTFPHTAWTQLLLVGLNSNGQGCGQGEDMAKGGAQSCCPEQTAAGVLGGPIWLLLDRRNTCNEYHSPVLGTC